MNSERQTQSLANHGGVVRLQQPLRQRVHESIVKLAPALGGVTLSRFEGHEAFILAVFFVLCQAAVFTSILYMTTKAEMSRKFLSLDAQAAGTICKEVPQVLKGSYQASYDGYWDSMENFRYNKSVYILQFNGVGVDNEQFANAMQFFTQKLKLIGQKATSRQTLWSLMSWAGFSLVHPDTKLEFFSSADAGVIFDTMVVVSFVTSVSGA